MQGHWKSKLAHPLPSCEVQSARFFRVSRGVRGGAGGCLGSAQVGIPLGSRNTNFECGLGRDVGGGGVQVGGRFRPGAGCPCFVLSARQPLPSPNMKHGFAQIPNPEICPHDYFKKGQDSS